MSVAGQTPDDAAKVARAQVIFKEAVELVKENTAESVQAALTKFEAARILLREADDKEGQAYCLGFMARAADSLGDKKKAVEYYEQAIVLFKAFGDLPGAAVMLREAGGTSDELGEKLRAIEYLGQTLPIFRTAGDKAGEVEALNYIGKLYNDLQQNRKALEYFTLALPLRRELKDKKGEGQTLANLGRVHSDLGENQKALEYLNLALPIRRAVGDRYGEALTLNNIGKVYNDLGENRKALEHYNLAIPIFKELEDGGGLATALANVGTIHSALGDRQKALDFFNQSLAIHQLAGNKTGEGNLLNNLGALSNLLGDNQKALKYLNQALLIAREAGDRSVEAKILTNLGKVNGDLGKFQEAIENYNQALPLYKAVEDKLGEAAALNNLMAGWGSLGSTRFAVAYGKQAVNKYQFLRQSIQEMDTETRRSYLKTIEGTYRLLAEILIDAGRVAEAQQTLNSFKDQQSFDFDTARDKQLTALSLTARETNFADGYEKLSLRLGTSQQQFNDLQKLVGARPPTADELERARKFDKEITGAIIYFAVFLANSGMDFAGQPDASDAAKEIPDTREMQNILRETSRQTGQKAVAVYQLVGEKYFRAIVVTPDSIKAVSTPIENQILNERAKQLWALLQSDRYDSTVLSKQIYDTIFKPLEKELPKDTQTILWAMDDNLRYVPMAALYDGKQFLVERFQNVVFTRADKERLTRGVAPVWTGTGFGSTKAQTVALLGDKISFNALPGVSEELREIFKTKTDAAGILSGEVLPDEKFNRTAMLAALRQKRPLVHIASHFSFRPGDAARSFLLMGDGTAFTLADMKKAIRPNKFVARAR